jgi:hypothetical protein
MGKFNMQTSFGNAVITKDEQDVLWIEEFKVNKEGVATSLGKFNLSEKLENILNTNYITLAFTVKTELEPDEN